MDENGSKIKSKTSVSEKTLREMLKNQRVANATVHKAQEENRSKGVPNWYSINGKIINEAELEDKNKSQK